MVLSNVIAIYVRGESFPSTDSYVPGSWSQPGGADNPDNETELLTSYTALTNQTGSYGSESLRPHDG